LTDNELLEELYNKGYLSIREDSYLSSRIYVKELVKRLKTINEYDDLEIADTGIYHPTNLVDIHFVYNSNVDEENYHKLMEEFERMYWEEEKKI
jgi:hypothetical protein